MRHAAATVLRQHPFAGPVGYVEHPRRRTAFLVDAVRYRRATTQAQQRAALLWAGPVPQPSDEHVAAAYHCLAYAGHCPGHHAPDRFAAAVLAPSASASAEDLAFYRRALAAGQLTAAQRAVYESRLKAAGK